MERSEDKFLQLWEKELILPNEKRSLLRPLAGLVDWCNITIAFFLYVVFATGNFASPLLMNVLLDHLSKRIELPTYQLAIFVCLIFLAPMVGFISKEQVSTHTNPYQSA